MSCRRLQPIVPLTAVLLALLSRPGVAGSTEPKESGDEIDRLALAAILVQDGHYDRAEAVLRNVDPEQEGLDLARYTMLSGLVALKGGREREAAGLLEKSIEHGQTNEVVYVFLAQARFATGDYAGTLQALDAAGETADELPGSFMIRAQCHWRRGEKAGAYAALERGLRRYTGNLELLRHKVLLLVDMGLFQEAREQGQALLSSPRVRADDYVAIAEALRRGKQHDQAAVILEQARLRYPHHEPILKQLARTYLDAGRSLTAGRLFHEAARLNPSLTVEVAELYRRAGRLIEALWVNAQVTDQAAKIRQRLGLLIELERFEQAAGLERRLSRLGLLEDETVAYAMAYSFYRTGRLERAEGQLKRIREPAMYQKAIELRRAIEVCRTTGWACE